MEGEVVAGRMPTNQNDGVAALSTLDPATLRRKVVHRIAGAWVGSYGSPTSDFHMDLLEALYGLEGGRLDVDT